MGEQALRAAEARQVESIVLSVGAGFVVGVTVRVSGGEKGRKLSAPIEDFAIALHISDEVRVPFLRGARRKHNFDLTWGA